MRIQSSNISGWFKNSHHCQEICLFVFSFSASGLPLENASVKALYTKTTWCSKLSLQGHANINDSNVVLIAFPSYNSLNTKVN